MLTRLLYPYAGPVNAEDDMVQYDPATEREHAKVRVLMKISRALRPYVQAEDEDLGERSLISVVYARWYQSALKKHADE